MHSQLQITIAVQSALNPLNIKKVGEILIVYKTTVCVLRFEVFTEVVMKRSIFCNITPCSPLKVNRHFGGICRLRLQSRRISQARSR
jgi:hypothetical protein